MAVVVMRVVISDCPACRIGHIWLRTGGPATTNQAARAPAGVLDPLGNKMKKYSLAVFTFFFNLERHQKVDETSHY